jgi:hypothetical protein
MGRACSTYVREAECIQGFGENARKKETLERPTRRWLDSIKMDLRETGWGGIDWINTAQNRDQWWALVNNEPSGSIICWEILE